MDLNELDYELPKELIASEPARPRDTAKLLVVDRSSGRFEDSRFLELPRFIIPGDTLVFNNTRVIRARVRVVLGRPARQEIPGEVLFVHPVSATAWTVLVRPGKRIRAGDRAVSVAGETIGTFGPVLDHGMRVLEVGRSHPEMLALLDEIGELPIPPYLERPTTAADEVDYQTVFGQTPGAVAAPTAGLHFSAELLTNLKKAGAEIAELTLHVGPGTFLPVRVADLQRHRLVSEHFEIPPETAGRINAARASGRRVIAVGTTTARALEQVSQADGRVSSGKGEADIYILPGHRFRAIDGLVTNFHLPKSTLLALVVAFAGLDLTRTVYQHAISSGYRFYSYGDGMLMLGEASR